jgi:hypothetical protein
VGAELIPQRGFSSAAKKAPAGTDLQAQSFASCVTSSALCRAGDTFPLDMRGSEDQVNKAQAHRRAFCARRCPSCPTRFCALAGLLEACEASAFSFVRKVGFQHRLQRGRDHVAWSRRAVPIAATTLLVLPRARRRRLWRGA